MRSNGTYQVVRPGSVSVLRHIPPHIAKPSYWETGWPPEPEKVPEVKSSAQITSMRSSCQLARFVLDSVSKQLSVGMTTDEIDLLVHTMIVSKGAYPSPLNYRGFPKSVCTSVNNVACHGIPDNRPLHDGDIINIDVTVYFQGYHGDCSATYLVGAVDTEGKELVSGCAHALQEAISVCRPGQLFSSIGTAVEKVAKEHSLTVVPAFTGHGIGSYFHGPPDIYHCYNTYPGTMEPGMTFTIEPVLSQGAEEVMVLEDGWTAVTADNGRAAQFEHTVLITSNGVEILT